MDTWLGATAAVQDLLYNYGSQNGNKNLEDTISMADYLELAK